MERVEASSLYERPVVTDKGRRLGLIADFLFDERTGEIVHIILKNPTENAVKLGLEKTKDGYLVPFSSVKAIGDFVVVSEEDLV
ncbi:hypothetical protein BA065_01485 [Nanoarchaeota archaeon NZ13-N]|uniref:PRC-barrel domain-containing protein n=1 Tax=Candidatus Nanoclepta minutus TaxID=1940235 RepID=A0A397WNM4_9ARCH|nr:MAG: hypothetical protein BA065_01485 [Nanoarchaeota archaeon NZ13-N]RIB35680.1 MAG: hypothetical protein BXU00_01105 [Candidatus Nanoclepta minutus]